MSHFSEQIIRRLDDIHMTESERRAAIISLQRAERVADVLIALASLAHRANAALRRGIGVRARELNAWFARLRRGREISQRRHRAGTRRPGTT